MQNRTERVIFQYYAFMYKIRKEQNSLPMARVAEIGNLLLSFMSAWIVGNVEAPAKANMMDPNAESCLILDQLFK